MIVRAAAACNLNNNDKAKCHVEIVMRMNSALLSNVQTKPGVIRPMTAIPRLTVDDEEEFHPNPFRQFDVKRTFADNNKVTWWHQFMLRCC